MINATINIHTANASTWMRLAWALRSSKIRIAIPSNWDEVPPNRRMKVVAALMNRGQISHEAMRLLLLKTLVSLPNRIFFRIRNIDFAEKLLPYVDWVLDAPISYPFAESIKIGKTNWLIPKPAMMDMSISTYFRVEKRWSAMATKADADLVSWLAAFLRPDNEATHTHLLNTGLLPNVSDVLQDQYAGALAKVSSVQAFYLVQYYSAQRVYIKSKYANIFEGSSSGKSQMDWDSIPAKIAEAGVFGSLKEVLATPIASYLAWANVKAQEAAKEEQKSLQDMIRSQHQKFLA